jgi:ABC-type transport system substrate-binding protein
MSLLKQWRHLLLAVIAIAALGALAACGDDDTGGSASPTQSGSPSGAPSDAAPDSDQKLTMNIRAEPGSIDPQAQGYTYEATVVNTIYTTLFWQDPTTSQLTPRAALEVPTKDNGGISADNLTYTIKLNPDLMWSDGTPVTAADFVYGIERGFNLNVAINYGGFFTNLKGGDKAIAEDPTATDYFTKVQADLAEGVVAVDAHTLKLVADHASASFLSNFVLPINSAVKQSNVEAVGDTFGTAAGAAQMVTDGFYMVKEWVAGDHLTLVPNPYYKLGHPAYIKEMTMTFTEDQNQAFTALQSGQADEAPVPPTSLDSVKDDPGLHQEPEFGMRWIYVDVTIPPWNNKDFVIGINQATDRAAIAQDVYKGVRAPLFAPCLEGVLGCDQSVFGNLDFDLTAAKASVAAAYPSGTIPEITIEVVNDPTTQSLAQTLQSQWQQIPGVKVNIVTAEQNTLVADMKAHKSGTQISGWQMDYADASDLWVIWLSTNIPGTNKGFWDRPDYDTLEKQQDAQFDSTQRVATLKQLQQFLAADPPAIFFSSQTRTNLYSSKVKGVVESPFDFEVVGDNFIEEMYISK